MQELKTPTLNIYKHPPAKDNPGRVSEGAARDMRNQAEAYHKGSQAEAILHLRQMGPRPDGTQRNAAKRLRRARRT